LFHLILRLLLLEEKEGSKKIINALAPLLQERGMG
jgi:hypothetical protein